MPHSVINEIHKIYSSKNAICRGFCIHTKVLTNSHMPDSYKLSFNVWNDEVKVAPQTATKGRFQCLHCTLKQKSRLSFTKMCSNRSLNQKECYMTIS